MARASEGEGWEDWSQWGECERANMRLEHVGGREGFVSNANVCVVLGAACRDIANGSASREAEQGAGEQREPDTEQRDEEGAHAGALQEPAVKRTSNRAKSDRLGNARGQELLHAHANGRVQQTGTLRQPRIKCRMRKERTGTVGKTTT